MRGGSVKAILMLFDQYHLRRAHTPLHGAKKIRRVREFYAQRPRPWRWKGALA